MTSLILFLAPFHLLLIRYPRWTRNCVTGLRSFKGSAGSMRLWFLFSLGVLLIRPNSTADVSIQGTCRYAISSNDLHITPQIASN